jgi:pyridoxine kinase
MARVLAISSQVARGHVGLCAIGPALQRLGHEVVALPTILLSNHPGHAKAVGEQVSPELLRRMFDCIEANGWLGEIDAVMTGYLPSAAHVRFACEAIDRLKVARSDRRVLVDPILGDEPKGLYIDRKAAELIASDLVPMANVITPNRFELGWLANDEAKRLEDVLSAARRLATPLILVTSVPDGEGKLANLLVEGNKTAHACHVVRRTSVPNGTGDLLAALYLGHELRLGQKSATEAFALAVAGVDAAIGASYGRDELELAASQDAWAAPPAVSLRGVG